MESIEGRINGFIIDNFPPSSAEETYTAEQNLIETGVVDSIGVLTLVTWLEQEFEIVVDDEDVVPENLGSIASLAGYVQRKLSAAGVAG